MTNAQWHLAQLNVGRLVAPLESTALAGFVAKLAPINALADTSPGFVWRLQTDEGDATSIRPTIDEALDRLERLRRDGPTPAAFTFRTPFQPGEEHPLDPVVAAEYCWPELAAS